MSSNPSSDLRVEGVQGILVDKHSLGDTSNHMAILGMIFRINLKLSVSLTFRENWYVVELISFSKMLLT
jgi:hypothetical protein